jgi:hypothetical protein
MSAPVTVWCYKLEEELLPGNGTRNVRLFARSSELHLPSAEQRMCESGPATRAERDHLRRWLGRAHCQA